MTPAKSGESDVSAESEGKDRAQLTAVAHERLTWAAAAAFVETRAAEAFITRQDDRAGELRVVAEEFRRRAKQASERQDALLKKLGMRT